MRIPPLVLTALSFSLLTACSSGPDKVAGDAGPAGAPRPTTRAISAVTSDPIRTPGTTAPATSRPAATTPAAGATGTTGTTGTPGATSTIRRTDWAEVNLAGLAFLGFGDADFRGGKASSGANNCTMLPNGIRPAYGEYIAEEPASSPVTEDALVLVDCGSDGLQQALVPVKLGFDGKTREAIGFIPADTPTGPGQRMVFMTYAVRDGGIVTTVRKADGTRETRRYRSGGGTRWERR